MDQTHVTIGRTSRKKFFAILFAGMFSFGSLIAVMGFTGTMFAMPLGGMGDFYVEFDEMDGEGFVLNPQIGETGITDEAPLVRNEIDQATIDNLHIYKDLKMPAGGWIRINITASEPTEIEGLIQDAQFIDANLMFDDMTILQTDTSGMTDEEVFNQNWSHDADKVTITDAKIVTDYLFQNVVALNGAKISLEHISAPERTSLHAGANHVSGNSKSEDQSAAFAMAGGGGDDGGGMLPKTASNIMLPVIAGAILMLIGGAVFMAIKKRRQVKGYSGSIN